MSRTWKLVLGGIGWGLAAFGALSLGSLPGDFGHSLCGPWGCLPPLQALAAMHLFWAVVLVPLVGWVLTKGQPHHLQLAGRLLFFGALLGIVVVAGRDLLAWLPTVPPEFRAYWARRALYTLVTLSDVPLVQVLLAGAICWMAANRERRIAAFTPARAPERMFSGKVGVLVLGLALTAMSCAGAQPPAAMKIRAPELQGIDEWINSKPLSLKALKGKVVVVHFWAFG